MRDSSNSKPLTGHRSQSHPEGVTWRLSGADFSSTKFKFSVPHPFFVSGDTYDDGGGENEYWCSEWRCPEQAVYHVGQLLLRVEAAGRCGVRATEIPLQVRSWMHHAKRLPAPITAFRWFYTFLMTKMAHLNTSSFITSIFFDIWHNKKCLYIAASRAIARILEIPWSCPHHNQSIEDILKTTV